MSVLDLPPCPPIAIEPTITSLGWSMEATHWNDTHGAALLRRLDRDAWGTAVWTGGRTSFLEYTVLDAFNEDIARKMFHKAKAAKVFLAPGWALRGRPLEPIAHPPRALRAWAGRTNMTILESDIAASAALWLESEGWTVSREVCLEWQLRSRHAIGDGRADIVATKANQIGVLEAKTTLSFELLSQAARWIDYAHVVWIVVPYAKMSEGRHEAFQIASRHYGFGVLECEEGVVSLRRAPKIRTDIDPALLVSLRPEHRTEGVAGSNRGGQWTSFRETGAALVKYVTEHPGCKLGDAVSEIRHHYRSKPIAVSSLEKAIRKGLIPVYVGWKQGLYPSEAEARGAKQVGGGAA